MVVVVVVVVEVIVLVVVAGRSSRSWRIFGLPLITGPVEQVWLYQERLLCNI